MAQQRRDKGDGSIFYNESKGLWIASIELPPGPDGKRRRKQVTSRDKDVVKNKLQAAKDAIADGLDPHSDQVTVATWCQHWLKDLAPRHVRPNTLANYRGTVDTYIVPSIGRVKLAELKPHHIREVHQAVIDAGRASGTALNAHWTLSALFESAVQEGMLLRNPCERVKPPKVSRQQRGALTAEQAKHLLSTSIEAGDPMASRWAAALLLGWRQGELLGLRWGNVDFDKGVLTLTHALDRLPMSHGCGDACGAKWASRCSKPVWDVEPWFEFEPLTPPLALVDPKTEVSRRVMPMPAPFQVMLEQHFESSPPNKFDLVWATPAGEPISPAADLGAWKRATKRAGLPPVVLHEARHSTATMLVESGVDREIVMSILGHASILTARNYVHTSTKLARMALSNLDALLE